MRILFAIFPLVCFGIGAVLMTRFSFNREEHARVRAAIDARRAVNKDGDAPKDPSGVSER